MMLYRLAPLYSDFHSTKKFTTRLGIMDEPSAFERVPNMPNAHAIEPEPKRERDNVYYFDNIVFEVCTQLSPEVPSGFT